MQVDQRLGIAALLALAGACAIWIWTEPGESPPPDTAPPVDATQPPLSPPLQGTLARTPVIPAWTQRVDFYPPWFSSDPITLFALLPKSTLMKLSSDPDPEFAEPARAALRRVR